MQEPVTTNLQPVTPPLPQPVTPVVPPSAVPTPPVPKPPSNQVVNPGGVSIPSYTTPPSFQVPQYQQPQNQTPPPNPYPNQAPMPKTFTSETPKKGNGVKGVLIVGILVLLMAGLVLGFGKARSFLTGAEGGCFPENLAEASLTNNSAEITFQTGKTCQTSVAYGTTSETLLLQTPKEEMAAANHRIKISPLLPQQKYFYQVVDDQGKRVGIVKDFTTKMAQGSAPPAETAVSPTLAPTKAVSPTAIPTTKQASPSGSITTKYTYEDFAANFGGTNPVFDIDKNGIVNSLDWLKYQKQN